VPRDSVGADVFSMFWGPTIEKEAQRNLRPFFSTKPKQSELELHLNPEFKPVALIVIQADPVVESPCT
jgi:hypothetical protein